MNRQTTSIGHLAEFSDWNRFPLPASFRGCVDHSAGLLATARTGKGWPGYIEQLAQSPFGDIALGRLALAEPASDAALTQLRQRAPGLTPWLDAPAPAELDSLTRLVARHPQCGIQLRVQLGGRSCEQIGQQLEALVEIVQQLHSRHAALCLVLQDAPGASPQQLQLCVEFAQHFAIDRVTLCDQQARLTPLGVRNLLSHLSTQFPELQRNGPALAFKANDRHGLALANSMAAIANGIHFVHGAILTHAEQDSPLALNQLLGHYALPQVQQAQHYAQLIGQLTGLPSANATAPRSYPLEAEPLAPLERLPAPSAQGSAAHNGTPRFIFKVSADDWHVQLLIQWGAQQLDLGERVHHYVLLLLAREYCQQQQQACQRLNGSAAPDPMSLGWVEREHLHKMIGDSQAQLNVKLFRAIKQVNCVLGSAGLRHYKPVLTRVGSLRFACPDFCILKDSTLEHDVRAWMPVSPANTRAYPPAWAPAPQVPQP
ncbi:hypothetical protein [Pseudomonas sp.]|uniref:hypothetical protein n=1 Tax=Pseudomonas sp. TaxID=306 RepID=UPI002732E0B8|nr:hypothetical protein [Pseudomonas sp.]MDP3815076.1 hypothetical protein [Pseudomonas sp.]